MPKFNFHWYHFFYIILFLFYGFLLARPINLTNQDLGRHIANGRELISGNLEVLSKNYYSYTNPDRDFINHHWLFGLIAFLIEQGLGFIGIHWFHTLILLLVLFIFLKIIAFSSNHFFSLLLGLPAVMLLSLRSEVRPESLGLLFLVNSLYQLKKIIAQDKVSKFWFVFLLIQQLIWVNTHISFIFGLFLPFLLWSNSAFFKNPQLSKNTNKKLFWLFLCLAIVSLINPNFIQGFLQPLTIFTDYGYSVIENQTLLFLWRVIKHPTIFSFVIIASLTGLLLIIRGKVLNIFELSVCFIGLIMGYMALRNIPIFVIFVFPILAKLIASFLNQNNLSLKKITINQTQKILILAQLYVFVLALTAGGIIMPHVSLSNRMMGLLPNQGQAAAYIKDNNIQGPIFNNYDLGSYLIYHHPNLRVFVDNRPEAYGKDFFQKTYIPMQNSQEVWQEQLKDHQFRTIIFGAQDITPWAIEFMNSIAEDDLWQLEYQDAFIKIWTRN